MPIYTKRDFSLLFIHIPKTAGSSIESHLRENHFTEKWRFDHFNILSTRPSPQHRTREQIREHLAHEKIVYDQSFAFVRDPEARLVSEYFHQCRSRQQLIQKTTHRGFSFWVDHVFDINAENPAFFDNHILPQSNFLLEDTKVFRFEEGFSNYLVFMLDLNCKYGLDLITYKIPHINLGSNKTSIEISKTTRQKIREFYHEDYSLLYPELLRSLGYLA